MITKNSKNRLIYPTPEGIENFWKWFGDSKVVDDQGRPLIMYHGTRWEFDEFKKNKLGKSIDCPWSNLGFFFTEDYELASKFSNGKKWYKDYKSYLKGSNVIPVYLSMKNPYYIEAHRVLPLSGSRMGIFNLKNDCIANGYDGIVIGTWKDSFNTSDNVDGELKYPQYVVFSPEQIKSAIGNVGSFNPKNHSISENIITNFKIFEDTFVIGSGEGSKEFQTNPNVMNYGGYSHSLASEPRFDGVEKESLPRLNRRRKKKKGHVRNREHNLSSM